MFDVLTMKDFEIKKQKIVEAGRVFLYKSQKNTVLAEEAAENVQILANELKARGLA